MQSLFIFVLREIKADGRKLHPIFLAYFTKKLRFVFIVNVHKEKQTFYNSDYLHD